MKEEAKVLLVLFVVRVPFYFKHLQQKNVMKTKGSQAAPQKAPALGDVRRSHFLPRRSEPALQINSTFAASARATT